MRLFLAAEIGERLAGRAADLIRQLARRTADAAPRARLTWLTGDRLHVTVRFIGEVDDLRTEAITAALESPLSVEPFDLTLTGIGAFPTSGPPRVLWIGTGQGRDDLIATERDISSRLATLGIPAEDRPYNPHLTLARVREAAGLRLASLVEGLGTGPLGTTRIEAITLFQSRLSSNRPAYVPLLRTPLRTG